MAFFEQLGKRLTDAGQNVAQQTKNFTNVTQLNSEISDKEKKISKLYLNIGQLYYEEHRGDSSAEYREIVEEIDVLCSEIAQSREKIKQIKGVVKCPKCGADVPLNAAFCNVCGTKIVQTMIVDGENGGARYCPKCHAVVAADHLFCNSCGAKMDEGGQDQ